MLKRYFIFFLLLIAIIEMYAQVREVVHHNGNYYSQATLMVDTIYNVTYERDTLMVVVPSAEGIVYPNNEAMGQFVTWMHGHPVYATPIVQYDSVAHRRNIAGDTLRIIFSNSTDALPQYEKEPIVWQHRQVTITDSAQLLSAEQYNAIAQGDTVLFIIEPTIIYTDTLYIRNIVDTVYGETHEYVDLGLSVKWATSNVGAESPEDYGDYFAWGETEPKAKYGWAQYKWGNGENKALTKYCNKAAYGEDGFTDNLTQLLPEDDAAHVNWGGNWRMPTAAEFDELINNCMIEKTTVNGVNGYLLTSKINGNSIFLPMAGCYNFDLQQDKLYANNSILYYWSADMMYRNTVYTNINAYNLSSRSTEDGGLSIGNNTRRCGFPIRPVYEAPKSSKQ